MAGEGARRTTRDRETAAVRRYRHTERGRQREKRARAWHRPSVDIVSTTAKKHKTSLVERPGAYSLKPGDKTGRTMTPFSSRLTTVDPNLRGSGAHHLDIGAP